MSEYIYALVTTCQPDRFLYVGRTNDLVGRLIKHARDSLKNPRTKKELYLNMLLTTGKKLDIVVLEELEEGKVMGAEDLWITNMEAEGHPLLNSKAGDTDRFNPKVSKRTQKWTPDVFMAANWEKGDPLGNKDEWSFSTAGIFFFRKSWSRLRMKHPHYGWYTFGGVDKAAKIKDACLTLTPGTEQHKEMVESVKERESMGYNIHQQ